MGRARGASRRFGVVVDIMVAFALAAFATGCGSSQSAGTSPSSSGATSSGSCRLLRSADILAAAQALAPADRPSAVSDPMPGPVDDPCQFLVGFRRGATVLSVLQIKAVASLANLPGFTPAAVAGHAAILIGNPLRGIDVSRDPVEIDIMVWPCLTPPTLTRGFLVSLASTALARL